MKGGCGGGYFVFVFLSGGGLCVGMILFRHLIFDMKGDFSCCRFCCNAGNDPCRIFDRDWTFGYKRCQRDPPNNRKHCFDHKCIGSCSLPIDVCG